MVVGAFTTPFGAQSVGRTADAPPPSVIVDVRDGRGLDSLPADAAPPPEQASVPSRLDVPEPPTAQPVDQGTVVVTTGDNLWDLSAAALARAMGRERASLGNDEIARYWSVVCDANRASLRSGDVNLIYPGELIVLPSVP